MFTDSFILAAASFVFGTILGSFLNALSFRFNTGRSVIWGGPSTSLRASRSRCMSCGHTLGALDLVPVFSYLLLRGRCRYCGARVSLQYPTVEVVAGVLSLSVWFLFQDPLPFALYLFVWMTILFIIVYDMRHTVIPWSASISLACATLTAVLVYSAAPTLLWALLAGPLLALPLFLISLVSRGQWMGWGDSMFELSLGWLLGLWGGITALMLAVWSGALVGVLLMGASLLARSAYVQKNAPRGLSRALALGVTMKSEIPFAPFLAFGAAAVFFFHVDFFTSLFLL